jgi:hypothetical protein
MGLVLASPKSRIRAVPKSESPTCSASFPRHYYVLLLKNLEGTLELGVLAAFFSLRTPDLVGGTWLLTPF